MDAVTDLHLHSKYSRAVSQEMNLTTMSSYARKKGLDILSTGDWTHPVWFREIKTQLTQAHDGLFKLKKNSSPQEKEILFLLSVEISCIFSQGGKGHRMHNLILSPGFETAEKINAELLRRGCNLSSDGRPIIPLSSRNLLELMLEIDEKAIFIPCHIWTPWFSLFGANSGFDSIEECFGDLSKYIYAVETGLSSDPEMNWQIKELDSRSILSFSDAHSPAKMGREATVMRLSSPSFANIKEAVMSQLLKSENKTFNNSILYTIEFYPEEGKYHYNGHRNCNVYQTPEETKVKGDICPVCHKRLTVGVMHRVQDLSNEIVHGLSQTNTQGLKWIKDPKALHPPFVKLVPLNEIIAESLNSTVASQKVKNMFDDLCDKFNSEIEVLLKSPVSEIEKFAGPKIAEGIAKVRKGDIYIKPGYDNEYGIVKIWTVEEKKEIVQPASSTQDQMHLDF